MSALTSAGTVTHTVLPTRLGDLTVVKEDGSLTGGLARKRTLLDIEQAGLF